MKVVLKGCGKKTRKKNETGCGKLQKNIPNYQTEPNQNPIAKPNQHRSILFYPKAFRILQIFYPKAFRQLVNVYELSNRMM